MRTRSMSLRGFCLAALVGAAWPASAQEAVESQPQLPPGDVVQSDVRAAAPPAAAGPSQAPGEAPSAGPESNIDPATIPFPDLAFEPDEETIRNYRKYFYFHREGTDFATAYADILECDAYSRGFAHLPGMAIPYPYAGTLGGALGGAIGNAMADAIWGSAQRRELRRINMRRCMTFKEYRIYGLPKSLWEEFNFEEGLTAEEEGRRTRLLQIQARVASGPTPLVGEIRK